MLPSDTWHCPCIQNKWSGNGIARTIACPGVPCAFTRPKHEQTEETGPELPTVARASSRAEFNCQLNMAQPISLNLPARDPRAELHVRLQNAPLAHAEA